MPKLTRRLPKYSHHLASQQAVVFLNRKTIYLGPWGSPASKKEYDRILGLWLANGRQLPPAGITTPLPAVVAASDSGSDEATDGYEYGGLIKSPADVPAGVTIIEVIHAYIEHASAYYVKNGQPTSELRSIKAALSPLKRMYGWTVAAAFDSLSLKKVRDAFVDAGQARKTVNQNVGRLCRMFKWAASEKLVPATVYFELRTVDGLRYGRSKAHETEPVKPVPWDLVAPLEPFIAPPVWAMMNLQFLTGMRSGEVVRMRGCDIQMTGDIWLYRPPGHKTEHHGHLKVVDLGPRAQTIIRQVLTMDMNAYLFPPPAGQGSRGGHEYRRKKKGGTGGRTVRARYDPGSYRRAIARAIEKAFPPPPELRAEEGESDDQTMKRLGPQKWAQRLEWVKVHHWHPHQLRHAAGTRIRKEFGLEAARIILGHKSMAMTELYAEADREHARAIVRKMG